MANRIEITVSGRNEMPATFAEIKGQAAALGADAGKEGGAKFSGSFTDTINDAIPPGFEKVTPKIQEPVKKAGKDSAGTFTKAFGDQLGAGFGQTGVFGGSLGDALGKQGAPAAEKFTTTFSHSVKDAMAQSSLSGLLGPGTPEGEKIAANAKETGQKAGQDMGGGISPLLVTALTAGLAVGAPVILAGFGALMGGLALIADRGNKVIAADLTGLGKTAEDAVQKAAAPLSSTLHAALTTVNKDVTALEPQLAGLFAAAEPDLGVVTQGVDNFAKGVLPGLSSALSSSQGIVQDFSNSLGPLGQGVGGFFSGLTRDSYTTGAGMESLLGTVGHLASTLGGVLGSAASVGSTALMGLDPVLNTTFSLIDKIANPATVGALAGVFGAMKLGGDTGSLTKGLTSISTKLGGFAKDAESTAGAMGGLKSAAGGVGSAFGKAADVMSGPWGIAIGAGVGLATGLVGALLNASHASDALTLSQQGLDQAVQQDNGHIGSAITAYVAAQAQTDGLAKSAANANVSLATWTQAVIGNKQAQDAVITSINTVNQVTQTAAATTDDAKTQTGKFSGDLQDATTSIQDNAAATNKLTDQNKQLINSMHAQHQQIIQAVQQQANYQAAMNTLTNSTDIFRASLDAQRQAGIAADQQYALSQVAALNLGTANVGLSQQLYGVVTAYREATKGASGYATILDGLNGTADTLAQAQNAVDQQLVQARTTFKANGDAITGMTTAAVANRGALNQAATAIQALGTAQYQATGDINKANGTIQQQIDAYVKATGATGKAKTAIEQYLEQLAKIPPGISTTVMADTKQASLKLNSLLDQMDTLSAGGTVHVAVQEYSGRGYSTGGAVSFAASGGAQGGFTWMNEQGPELVNLPTGAQVMPASNTASMLTSTGGGGYSNHALVLEVVGGEPELVNLIKKIVRVRGGGGTDSVQRAFGQRA